MLYLGLTHHIEKPLLPFFLSLVLNLTPTRHHHVIKRPRYKATGEVLHFGKKVTQLASDLRAHNS